MKKVISFLIVLALICLPGSKIFAAVPSGFTMEVFVNIQKPNCLAFAPEGSSFGTDLFVGSCSERSPELVNQTIPDYIYAISPTGSISLFATLLAEADPWGMEFSPIGSAFGDLLYVSANNRDTYRANDCGGAIQSIDLYGNIIDFTSLTSSLPCQCNPLHPPITALAEPKGLRFGPGGAFGIYLYVTNSSDPPADIMRVDSSGVTEIFVNDDLGSIAGMAPIDVEFSLGGEFGYKLYFTDFGNAAGNCVRTADSYGNFSDPFVYLPGVPTKLRFGPGGDFGTDLYVAVNEDTGGGSIYIIHADGSYDPFANGFGNCEDIVFNVDGTALFVADFVGNKVYKIYSSADADSDNDGIPNVEDNCPDDANADQANFDGDLHGDVCDNCPDDANDDQANSDGDQYGNVCDPCPDDPYNDLNDVDQDGVTPCDGDCDDHDPTVYPGAPGTKKNKDNDCNGKIDSDEKKKPKSGGGSSSSSSTGFLTGGSFLFGGFPTTSFGAFGGFSPGGFGGFPTTSFGAFGGFSPGGFGGFPTTSFGAFGGFSPGGFSSFGAFGGFSPGGFSSFGTFGGFPLGSFGSFGGFPFGTTSSNFNPFI